ncbi:MAG TPA: LysM domain-containing protein, partial [Chloroflexota bacterium]
MREVTHEPFSTNAHPYRIEDPSPWIGYAVIAMAMVVVSVIGGLTVAWGLEGWARLATSVAVLGNTAVQTLEREVSGLGGDTGAPSATPSPSRTPAFAGQPSVTSAPPPTATASPTSSSVAGPTPSPTPTATAAPPTATPTPTQVPPTATPEPSPTPRPTTSFVYTVQPGDSLAQLSARFGISVQTIAWANDISVDSFLYVGQSLRILPVDGVEHLVQEGDTLSGIAARYQA